MIPLSLKGKLMDELLEFLKSKYHNSIISGSFNRNILIWANKTETPILLLGITLVVGVSVVETEENIASAFINAYKNNDDIRTLFYTGKKIATRANLPFLAIAYSIENITEHGFFVYDNASRNHQTIKSAMLAQLLNSKFGVHFSSDGTKKEVNICTADPFHDWSRAHLSSNFSKVDIDALFLSNGNIIKIIEIKRSPTRAVGKWKPFFADATNYEVESLLSKAMGTEFVTLHHCEKGKEVTKETEISYFQIISVNSAIKESEGNWIVYVDKTPQKAESIFESS
jgi:hypothetical protein